MRGFRALLVTAMRARWITIARHARPLRRCRSRRCRFVPRQFFPASDRPELLVDLTPAAERLDLSPARRRPSGSTRCCRAIPTSSAGAPMSAAAPSASTCRSTSQLPNDFFAQAVDRRQGRRGARPAAGAAREGAGRGVPGRRRAASPRSSSGPPVGWPVQYRVSGPDVETVRDIALELAQAIAANADARGVNFDWIEPARQLRDPDRPGPGAAARPELADAGRRCSTRS